jgi:hypothetical protein
MLQTLQQRGPGLAARARHPVTVTIPKRDWLQLMQVFPKDCEPDLAEWVTEFRQTVETAIQQAESPAPYAAHEAEADDLDDWLSTLIAYVDRE